MTKEEFIQDFNNKIILQAAADEGGWDNFSLSKKNIVFEAWKEGMLKIKEITQQVYDSIGTLPNEYK